MSKHPLAIVCALAFVIGGASAFVLEYAPQGETGVQGFAGVGAGVGGGASAVVPEAAEARPDEPTRPEGMSEEVKASDEGLDSAPQADDASAERPQSGGEAAGAVNRSAGVKRRATAEGRSGEGRRAARGYTRVSGEASGGRGIAGYTVGGVKKTGGGVKKAGVAIGKTFGKIGGVFHD